MHPAQYAQEDVCGRHIYGLCLLGVYSAADNADINWTLHFMDSQHGIICYNNLSVNALEQKLKKFLDNNIHTACVAFV